MAAGTLGEEPFVLRCNTVPEGRPSRSRLYHLLVEDLRSIIEHLPRYSSSEEGPTGELTLTVLRDRALLLVGWTGALRRSELVALTTEDIQFIEGEGVNRSKADQEAEGLVKGLPYGSNKENCPVTALKRNAESAGLDPEEYSAHSLRASFITQAIRAGKPERRVKEHSGHSSRETSLIISGHALAECYSSLTALPLSPAVTPGQARRLIEENVAEAAEEIVRLGADEYLRVLQRMTDLGLESGAVYDALHILCAEKASADELRTFNGADFRRMPPEGATELVVL